MTRIIAGRAGSIPLEVPDAGTRPTSDRVRESLFGALESAEALRSAAVLDLYAGTGALGLEALSRGAASVDLVEKSPHAATVAQRNADKVAKSVGRTGIVRVHRAAVAAYLAIPRGPFDIVFLDPPYDLDDAALRDALGLLGPSLTPAATVIVERATRSGSPSLPESLTHARHKRYGDTTLWWVHPSESERREGATVPLDRSQPDDESQSR
ncbi:16S rRNA (guanine(966)-N(2))-methyltransferase RsmD [Microbacterium sp. P01]|uniref:16S rRNA (guanine(966)-N(2))-methyltransferase RsmD n=1 Tax=unclassified Microbacterium TaxID=2609290 RepID=UPI00366CC44E